MDIILALFITVIQVGHDMGIEEAEIQEAVSVGKMVRKGAADQMDKLLETEILK